VCAAALVQQTGGSFTSASTLISCPIYLTGTSPTALTLSAASSAPIFVSQDVITTIALTGTGTHSGGLTIAARSTVTLSLVLSRVFNGPVVADSATLVLPGVASSTVTSALSFSGEGAGLTWTAGTLGGSLAVDASGFTLNVASGLTFSLPISLKGTLRRAGAGTVSSVVRARGDALYIAASGVFTGSLFTNEFSVEVNLPGSIDFAGTLNATSSGSLTLSGGGYVSSAVILASTANPALNVSGAIVRTSVLAIVPFSSVLVLAGAITCPTTALFPLVATMGGGRWDGMNGALISRSIPRSLDLSFLSLFLFISRSFYGALDLVDKSKFCWLFAGTLVGTQSVTVIGLTGNEVFECAVSFVAAGLLSVTGATFRGSLVTGGFGVSVANAANATIDGRSIRCASLIVFCLILGLSSSWQVL
jgi:hypothetical protein